MKSLFERETSWICSQCNREWLFEDEEPHDWETPTCFKCCDEEGPMNTLEVLVATRVSESSDTQMLVYRYLLRHISMVQFNHELEQIKFHVTKSLSEEDRKWAEQTDVVLRTSADKAPKGAA